MSRGSPEGGTTGLGIEWRHLRNYLSAQVVSRVVGVASLAILARLLSPEGYGLYSTYSAFLGVLTVLLTFNLHAAVGRLYFEEEESFPRALTSISLACGVVFCCGSLAVVGFGNALAKTIGLPLDLLLLALPMAAVEVVDSIYQQVFQAAKRSGEAAGMTAARIFVLFLAGVGLAWWCRESPEWGLIIGRLSAGIAIALFACSRLHGFFGREVSWPAFRRAAIYGVPLMPYVLSGMAVDFFDRLLINATRGGAEAGLYSFAYNVGMLISLLSVSLYQSFMPDYFRLMNEKRYLEVQRSSEALFRLILLATLFVLFFGRDIGGILGGNAFVEALPVIPVVAVGYALAAMFPLYGWHFGYFYRSGFGSLAVIIAGIANVLLNVLLIPRFGYAAAAWTTAVSYAIMVGMGLFLCRWLPQAPVLPLVRVGGPFLVIIGVWGGTVSGSSALSLSLMGDIALKILVLLLVGFLGSWVARVPTDEVMSEGGKA